MLVRCTSTVRCVTKSVCAISRLVGPSAAISATRRSLGVSEATPLRAIRRGRAPVASSSLPARAARGAAPQIVASSSAWRSCSRASERRLALRSAAPSSVRAFACSSFAGESVSTSTASRKSASPCWPPSTRPAARRAAPSARGAPQVRADVGEKEQSRIIGEGLADAGAGQSGRSIVELALLHQRLGEKGGGVRAQEASGRPPRLAGGEGLAPLGLRLGEVASEGKGLRAKDLRDREGEGRPAPVRLGERVLVDRQSFVEIGHREHGGGEDEGRAVDVLPDQ